MGTDVFAVVRDCIAESLAVGAADVRPGSKLVADLGADSLDFVDMLFMLEKRLGIKLRESELDFLSRLDFSSPEVMREGYLTRPTIERLLPRLPALEEVPDLDRVSPSQLFGLVTVETLVRIASAELARQEAAAPAAPDPPSGEA